MVNAKEEFLESLIGKAVVAAHISCYNMFNSGKDDKAAYLKQGYSLVEWEYFLHQLDFTYDNGYGTQELFGIVWLEDNAWLERAEYDGSEWWEYKQTPEIPEYLK